MALCKVRWRPSGGRGEFEAVPGTTLNDRRIFVRVDQLSTNIDSEVIGTISQGKPRLRKLSPNDRSKLHLVQLVMAIARLPEPAREDRTGTVNFPLEDKEFVVSEIDFEILADKGAGSTIELKPLHARILHSEQVIDLQKRFDGIVEDASNAAEIAKNDPILASAVIAHIKAAQTGKNSAGLRKAADSVIDQLIKAFGKTNSATAIEMLKLPETDLEQDIKGKEGRILTRLHAYKERDRKFIAKAKKAFISAHGRLYCECCGLEPEKFYGPRGESRIQAHHRTPVEELMPDAETTPSDLAMVCPNCHDIIHAKRPWITVEDLRAILTKMGSVKSP